MAKLIGVDKVLKNLNKEIRGIRGRTTRGIRESLLVIKGKSQDKTPIDTGNLVGSHYTEVGTIGKNPVGEVGVTADYGIFVHEDLEARHTVGEAKYLENAVRESKSEILDIIRKRAKV